uniref:Uncharacterized protein n=1 Tax=Ciona intestinalis TaxID=7719 RepID=H2XMW1_CIOIN
MHRVKVLTVAGVRCGRGPQIRRWVPRGSKWHGRCWLQRGLANEICRQHRAGSLRPLQELELQPSCL